MSLPDHLAALRNEALRVSCESWAIQKRWKLARGIDRAGPCPVCGGTDRFSIHTRKNTFNCRRCGIAGGGVIDLVMKTESVEFTRACEIVTGRSASAPVDEKRAAELRRQADYDAVERARQEQRYREAARKSAYGVWQKASRGPWYPSDPVRQYLELRGIPVSHLLTNRRAIMLRQRERLEWREKQGAVWMALHAGPAMIAAIQRPDGSFGAVHQTWLDLDQPKGRLALPQDADGRDRPSKKVLGVKKGGAIRLFTPDSCLRAERGIIETRVRPMRIVMGEGIETTLTALAHNFEEDTAYWAGVDLGNMSGRAARAETGGQVHDQPLMEDRDCFLPPDWCEELVYLCDGDEADNHTADKLVRGLRRALRLREEARAENPELPELRVSYVPPPEAGKDLNDLVRVAA